MSDEDALVLDTGLVAAAVTMSAPEPPAPEPVTVALAPTVTAVQVAPPMVPIPDGWDLFKVAALVTDMAQNMYDRSYILAKHSLTEEQMKFLEANEFYQRALEAEVLIWQGANSVQKRLALEAAIAIEANMPVLAARLGKTTEPLGEVVTLVKVLAEIAGLVGAKAQQNQAGSGQQFKIIFNINGEVTERTATPSFAPVQPFPEGTSQRQALSALVQAPGSGGVLPNKP